MLALPGDLQDTFKTCHMRWNYIMERWLSDGGTYKYPATWNGLYTLLEDVSCAVIADELKNVVTNKYFKN